MGRNDIGLGGLIDSYVDYKMEGVYTAIPAIILVVKEKQRKLLVDVQPLVSIKTREDEVIPESSILNVPLQMPASSVGGTVFPVKAGDNVLLVFSKRAIDTWKYGEGTPRPPNDFRVFSKNDCIAIPCIYPAGMSIVDSSKHSGDYGVGDVIIFNQRATGNSTEIILKENGDVIVNSPKTVTVNCKDSIVNSSNSSTYNTDSFTVNSQSFNVNTGSYSVSASSVGYGTVNYSMNATGDAVSTGSYKMNGSFVLNGIVIESHRHTGVESGPSTSGGPI